MQVITPKELKDWIQKDLSDFTLIDVRTHEEHEAFNIGGICIPFEELKQGLKNLKYEKNVVFYCSKGIRSLLAIQKFEKELDGFQVFNLSGGTEGFKADASL